MKNMRSIIAGLAFLVPALAFAAPHALAEGAAPPTQDVDKTSAARQAIQWTQDRLAEADATIAALERNAAALTGEARARADAAIKALREQRDAYRSQADTSIANAKSWTDAQVSAAQERLDANWTAFQSARDSYLDSAKADLATRRAVLQAELDARRTAWLQSVEDLRARAEKVGADQRVAIEARIAALKAQVDDAQARLARLEEGSSTAWKAVQKSYTDARTLFYETYRSIRKAIDDASE